LISFSFEFLKEIGFLVVTKLRPDDVDVCRAEAKHFSPSFRGRDVLTVLDV
jgi:hypothetical protein